MDWGSDKHANRTQHSKSVTRPEEMFLGAQKKTIKNVEKKKKRKKKRKKEMDWHRANFPQKDGWNR